MATKKVKEPTVPTRAEIIEQYADYCLTHGSKPATVYKFAKDNGYTEGAFYKHFPSFEVLEQSYFVEMFNHAVELQEQSPAYAAYTGVEKLSAIYFTFFEIATANRSFVVYSLGEGSNALKNLMKLRELRKVFTEYAAAVLENPVDLKHPRAEKIQKDALKEGAWVQFLSIFKFWMGDTSASFEKTDVFIEKSVKASNDLVYNSPINSLVDLGKFLWKEKFTV
jgi:AcrR family transcriptional regulator